MSEEKELPRAPMLAPEPRVWVNNFTGLDIHGGLRIRLEYDKDRRTILPKFSGESDPTHEMACADVEDYIRRAKQRLGYAEQWLTLEQARQR